MRLLWVGLCVLLAACSARPGGTLQVEVPREAIDYAAVFPQDEVGKLALVIDPADWAAMLGDMEAHYGPRGDGDAEVGVVTDKPIWVPGTVKFQGEVWKDVGLRFKGKSSLRGAWAWGTDKFPWKLDFDKWAKEKPEVEDRRFHGFGQLSLASNWADPTALRESIAYGLLAEAGLPAARTAIYEVTLDHGDGPVSQGLYTMVEVVDDTVVSRVFGLDGGNIYEPEGTGTAGGLAAGTLDQLKQSFEKENNEKADNWNDVVALYNALHSPLRTRSPVDWRAGLEKVFDVDGFVHWLAIAAVIQHWDSYGMLAHNYYLAHDPLSDKLVWFSWDHNLVLGGPTAPNLSFDRAEVGAEWPLIRFLLDDPVYHELYLRHMADTVAGPFSPEHMHARYENLAKLASPYMGADYAATVEGLERIATERVTAVQSFLAVN